jgi:ribosomal protein L24
MVAAQRPPIAKVPEAAAVPKPAIAKVAAAATKPAIAKLPSAAAAGPKASVAAVAKRPSSASGSPNLKKGVGVATFALGQKVKVTSGEFKGEIAEVVNVEDGDITVLVSGDVVIMSATELAPVLGEAEPATAAKANVVELEQRRMELTKLITQPQNVARFLNAGRLVHVTDMGWGILISAARRESGIELDVFIRGSQGHPEGDIEQISLDSITRLSKMRTKLPNGDVKSAPVRAALSKCIARLPAQINDLHPVDDMKIDAAASLLERIAQLEHGVS